MYRTPMRAVRCHELKGPAGLSVDEVPDPTPSAGEVVFDVRAAGVNFPDILITQGKYQFKAPVPFVPGGEASGVVSAVGAGVTRCKPGDRVVASMLHGAFAEKVSVPQESVLHLPDAVPFEVGAATILTYGTTIHALVDRAQLREGETLLVLGAAGGVGIAAVELGRLLGARVIAAASTDAKVLFARERGASEGIVYTREDLKERAKALTGGKGADVIYDPIGGDYAEPALRSIAWEGRYLVIGFAAGEIPKIPLNLVLLKGCEIVGVYWGMFAMRDPQKNRANCEKVLSWVADKKLAPHVDAQIPFDRAKDALERLARREVTGKLVLVPD
jgi:NADPH2:quinone reductase